MSAHNVQAYMYMADNRDAAVFVARLRFILGDTRTRVSIAAIGAPIFRRMRYGALMSLRLRANTTFCCLGTVPESSHLNIHFSAVGQ